MGKLLRGHCSVGFTTKIDNIFAQSDAKMSMAGPNDVASSKLAPSFL
jgi:hypothetical protein